MCISKRCTASAPWLLMGIVALFFSLPVAHAQSIKPVVRTTEDDRFLADDDFKAKVNDSLAVGDLDMDDYEATLDWARNNTASIYHPTGTCKMGSGKDAVVDDKLRVHGIQGLRVADCSIMPEIVSGNTNAPAIMIGEKASDLLLASE